MTSVETQIIRRGLGAILKFIRPFKAHFILLAALGIVSAVANGSAPFITGRFFDALISVSQREAVPMVASLPLWGFLLATWALVQLIANNIDWVMDRLTRKMDSSVHASILADGYTHLFRLPLSYHKRAHIGAEVQKLTNAGWRVSAIVQILVNFAPQFASILIGITLAATINLLLAGVLLVGVLLYVVLLVRILIPVARIDASAHRAWEQANGDAVEAVYHIESIKQAAAEDFQIEKTRSAFLVKSFERWYRLEIVWNNVGFFQRTIVFLTQLAVFVLSVKLVASSAITIGELVALNGYALMFFGPFVTLGYSWQSIQNGISAAAHADEIFDAEEERYVPAKAVSTAKLSGDVEFKNVSFRYSPDQPYALTNLNFHVRPGQAVALVGASGVGKSTAISLISAYNFSTRGRVLIDGTDTRRLRLTELRRHIAVVPQEVALFNDTIRANIRYGSFDATPEEVEAAARAAHIDEFIATLPKKYKTLVGERGVKLSTGQKQRIAIARAILRNPAILVLDEPTSALDAQTEQLVTESIERLMAGRTTFIIAHRLSTVRRADTIFVFDAGTIAEQGSHDELVARENGIYRHLYEYQIGLH